MKKIRTRYAPSPTGFLHIGGARSALFSYLFAKHYQGDFIIRIEDTDLGRNVAGGEASQLDNLAWLGIIPDESPLKPISKFAPYRQSEKIKRYHEIVKYLLETGQAYKAYDSPEEIALQKAEQAQRGQISFRYDRQWLKLSKEELAKREKLKAYTIRLALKSNYQYHWKDLVRGEIKVNTNDIGDFVILKQNKYPTFVLANVVDDHDMEISHVLRGEEHITNTPKQLALYQSLNWNPPAFGHLTIITNMEGKKLSKRDQSLKQFIEDYKNEGFIPEAIFNFLALLGWTHPEAKEKLSKQQLIADFDPQRLSKSPTKFDIKKMAWFSKSYMKDQSNEFLMSNLQIPQHLSPTWIELFLDTFKQSATSLNDLKEALLIYQNKDVKKMPPQEVVTLFYQELKKVSFNVENIQQAISNVQKITNLKGRKLFMPIRQATTYQDHGPELAKAIFLFGHDLIMRRLEACL